MMYYYNSYAVSAGDAIKVAMNYSSKAAVAFSD